MNINSFLYFNRSRIDKQICFQRASLCLLYTGEAGCEQDDFTESHQRKKKAASQKLSLVKKNCLPQTHFQPMHQSSI